MIGEMPVKSGSFGSTGIKTNHASEHQPKTEYNSISGGRLSRDPVW